jgi:hypothetical protein
MTKQWEGEAPAEPPMRETPAKIRPDDHWDSPDSQIPFFPQEYVYALRIRRAHGFKHFRGKLTGAHMKNHALTMPRLRPALCLCLGLVAIAVWVTSSHSQEAPRRGATEPAKKAPPAAAHAPQYTDAGELKIPEDFSTWVFVGSNLGLEYRDDASNEAAAEKDRDKNLKNANFHNVYINPEAFEHFTRTGTFPDKTVLVLDIYKAEEGEPRSIVSNGLFPGKQKEIAVAVKNSARPGGVQADWAYYDFPLDRKTAKAFAEKACYDCHLQHADNDNVWVQFYPILRAKQSSAKH